MITNLIAVEPDLIADFEKGILDKKSFISGLKKKNILSVETFEIIDYVLTGKDEDSLLTSFTGEGEILEDAGGNAIMFEWIDFENGDSAKYLMCSPAVYKNKEDLEKAVKMSLSAQRDLFEKMFDFRKMEQKGVFIPEDEEYVRENREDIISASYEDFIRMRKFYHDALKTGKYVALFYLSDEN